MTLRHKAPVHFQGNNIAGSPARNSSLPDKQNMMQSVMAQQVLFRAFRDFRG